MCIFYFAYGSNMSSKRLQHRVPSAKPVCVATLSEHRLQWHKKGSDNSAKCDAEHTGDENHFIMGVVYEMLESEKPELDRIEGLGNGYEQKVITIESKDGESISAITYYATHIENDLKAYHWYKEHVVRGAREHGLHHEYISFIDKTESVADEDEERHRRELMIYRD